MPVEATKGAWDSLLQAGPIGGVAVLAILALCWMHRLHLALYREIILDQKNQIIALTVTIADGAKIKTETIARQAEVIAKMAENK